MISKKQIHRISAISIGINVFLFSLKLLGGLVTNSVALLSDAVNHLSDFVSGFVYWIGQRLSLRAPDDNHPQGHGRGEYLTALLIALLMFFVAGQFMVESIRRILNPSQFIIELWVMVTLVIAIVLKICLYLYLKTLHSRYRLLSMKALKIDNLFDVVISSVVLLSFLLQGWFTIPLDGYAGLAVAILIAINAGTIMLDGIREVLGKSLKLQDKIKVMEVLKQYPLVLGSHGYHLHDYGPTYQLLTFHAEVSDQLSLVTAHDLIDQIEEKLLETIGVQVLIHLDPIVTNNQEVERIQKIIKDTLRPEGLNQEVITVRPIQEKLHQEIVVIVHHASARKPIQRLLKEKLPQYRFCVESNDIN
jgi:cation diffusion facilitator family transporter